MDWCLYSTVFIPMVTICKLQIDFVFWNDRVISNCSVFIFFLPRETSVRLTPSMKYEAMPIDYLVVIWDVKNSTNNMTKR